jgi:hypothetical protein
MHTPTASCCRTGTRTAGSRRSRRPGALQPARLSACSANLGYRAHHDVNSCCLRKRQAVAKAHVPVMVPRSRLWSGVALESASMLSKRHCA